MDLILDAVAQIVFNFTLDLVVNFSKQLRQRRPASRTWKVLVAGIIGALSGSLSVAAFHHAFIPMMAFRIMYVTVVPVVTAQLVYAWQQRRSQADRPPRFVSDWLCAWAFTFTCSLVRLIGTLGYLKS